MKTARVTISIEAPFEKIKEYLEDNLVESCEDMRNELHVSFCNEYNLSLKEVNVNVVYEEVGEECVHCNDTGKITLHGSVSSDLSEHITVDAACSCQLHSQ